MLNKERHHREMGGILAGTTVALRSLTTVRLSGSFIDDMGLGKTVQAIALMVLNQPDIDDIGQRQDGRRQTLIVAPAALLDQVRVFRYYLSRTP